MAPREGKFIGIQISPVSFVDEGVDALLDRLQHHCVTIRMNGPSLRAPALASAPAQKSTTPTKTAKRTAK